MKASPGSTFELPSATHETTLGRSLYCGRTPRSDRPDTRDSDRGVAEFMFTSASSFQMVCRGTLGAGHTRFRANQSKFARCRCSRCCVRINARAGVADALAVHVRDWLDDLGGGSRAALGARLAQKIDVTCLCASLETLHEDLETDEERFHLRGNAQVLEAAVVRDQLQTEVDPNSENREFMGRHGRGPETLYRAQVVSLHSSPLYRCRSLAPRRLRCGIDFVV